MTIIKNHNTVFESPDGGKTVYARQHGSLDRHLVHQDPATVRNNELLDRWIGLRQAVFLDDPTINDLLAQIETVMILKR